MNSGLLLLVLAMAFIASLAGAQDASQCIVAARGEQYGVEHKMEKVYLTSGIRDWEVKIPKACGSINGVVSVVCDTDVEPDANYADELVLNVHRNGQLTFIGSVEATVYCG